MSEFKDLKMIMATEIVRNPESVKELTGKIRTLYDRSTRISNLPIKFDNLERAMSIMAENGWSPKTMAIESGPDVSHCFVIMEKRE